MANGSKHPTERTGLLSDQSSISDEGIVVIEANDGTKRDGYGVVNRGLGGKSSIEGEGSGTDEETGEIEGEDGEGGRKKETKQNIYFLFPAVALGILMSAADQTIIVSSYGKIGSDLDALNNTSWIASAYFLTLTSFQPLYGKLSDIFGRKPALLFAYTVFGLGCLFCGLSRTLGELVAARAFAGIGGGGMTTVVSILFSDIVPLRERGNWQGYMNIVYALGASAGAPIGGILSDSIGWRWAFIGQFPITMLASAIVYFVLDLPKVEDSHWVSKLKKIDFLGAFTLTGAVLCLLVGLDRGSNVSWSDQYTIIFCCVAIPFFAAFIFVEMKVASHPFAPGHIIFQRSLFASYASNFFLMSAYMGVMFYVPLYFQAVDGLSATQAGVRLIPVMICSVSGSLFGGRVMQWTGKYYWLTLGCVVLGVSGSIVVFLCSGLLLYFSWGLVMGLGMCAFGGGAAITTTLINVIANADTKDQAIATACSYLFRSLGSVVGVSIAATVVQQALRGQLAQRLDSGADADKIVEEVRRSLDFIKTLEPSVREIVKTCYAKATNATFGMSIGILVLSLVAAAFIKEKKLSK